MKAKILIVEDEAIEAMNFEQHLNTWGYDVVGIASTGENAISKAAALEPDLILMDIVLKGEVDGIEAAAQIKHDFDIPVIYLTAHPEDSTVNRAKLTAPHGYIIKPVNKTDLKNTIELALYMHQVERKLKESESKYRSIFENSMYAILLTTPNGEVLDANPAAEHLFGYSREEICQLGSEGLVDLNDPHLPSLLEEREFKGKAAGFLKFIKKGGSKFTAEVAASIFKDLDGNKRSSMLIKDISDDLKSQKALRDSEERFRMLFEQSSAAMMLIDPDTGDIVDANPAAVNFYGYSLNLMQTMNIENINLVTHEKTLRALENAKKEGKYFVSPQKLANGEIRTVEIISSPISFYNKVILFSIVNDITDRKKADERIDRLYRLYATLSQINQSIVRIKDRKELFKNICKVCVVFGKFRMAWIGLIDDSGYIKPVTHHGQEQGYLKKISINVNDEPSIHKPTPLAVNRGQVVINENIKKELNREWSTEALKRGFKSLAVIPFKLKGEVIGTLNIYASEPNFFVEDEINLAEEISLDISYALDAIESEEDLRIVNDAFVESERSYRELVDNSMVAIYKTNLTGELLYANDAMAKIFQFKNVQELKKKNAVELYSNPKDREKIIEKLKEEGSFSQCELNMISGTGDQLTIILSASLVSETISGMIMDITQRKQAELAVKRNEERFRAVAESAVDAIVTTDIDGKILFCNASLSTIFGYPFHELIGKNLTILMPDRFKDDYIYGLENFKRSGAHNRIGRTLETTGLKKDGTEFVFEMSLAAWKSGEKIYFTSIIRDITERLRAERKLKESIKEKDVLLKEIHHRVKNNLQIISSLLDIQEGYVKESPTAVNVLKESQNRVLSMAMIHEMLYQTQNLNHINFGLYLQNMTSSLYQSYGVDRRIIKLILNVEEIFLNIETAIPLGLIISELITNSLKYAFPNENTGELMVDLQSHNSEYILFISDNGIGIPETVQIDKTKTLGLRLVNILTKQIDATLTLDLTKGTKFTIKFHELEYKQRL